MKTKSTSIIALLLCLSVFSYAQHLTPIQQSSLVQFQVSHKMVFRSTVTGSFSGLKGNIVFDTRDVSQSFFDVSVNAESINTGIGMRDSHLKDEDYFNAQKYPLIVIKSQKINKEKGDDAYLFTGTITMKGVTKAISFPFTIKAIPGGYQFKGNFNINRLDFEVGPENSIDKDVLIQLSVSTKQE
ncbi:YceI family protein [Mucilaginibacter sp.]